MHDKQQLQVNKVLAYLPKGRHVGFCVATSKLTFSKPNNE